MRLFLHDSSLDRTNVDGALDVAQTIALGALAAVPVIGLILREVVGTAFAELRFERVERFAAELSTDMTALGARIDRDFVRREEFAALTEQVLESVLQRRNAEKVAAFASVLAHSSTQQRPTPADRLRYLDDLDALRPTQIEVLRRLAAGTADWTGPSDVFTVGQVVNSKVAWALNGLGIDQLDRDDLGACVGNGNQRNWLPLTPRNGADVARLSPLVPRNQP